MERNRGSKNICSGYFTSNINGAIGALSFLMCFTEDGKIVYQNPQYNTCFYTSAESISNPVKEYKVYPNPVSGELLIEGNLHKEEIVLELYSGKGELVKTEGIEGDTNIYRIDVSLLKSGIYVLRMVSASGKYREEVIIKN